MGMLIWVLLMLALPVMLKLLPARIWLMSLLIWLLASSAMAAPLLMMPGLVLVTNACWVVLV